MKIFYIHLVICTALLTGCGNGETTESTDNLPATADAPATTATAEDIAKSVTESVAPTPKPDLHDLIDDFISCRDASTSRNDCRHWISKLICEYHGISDFNNGEKYVVFDSIRPIIERSDFWTRIGSGSDASVLSKAQENANNGLATLAIDVSQSYGMVVLVASTNTSKSGR
ncbi:MAG: hypothetical protein COB88_04355 [Flavobacteriales bacterium]|nr:MAG: hypothetical protein COB88_04355 [Flavobacteriales bacterium]